MRASPYCYIYQLYREYYVLLFDAHCMCYFFTAYIIHACLTEFAGSFPKTIVLRRIVHNTFRMTAYNETEIFIIFRIDNGNVFYNCIPVIPQHASVIIRECFFLYVFKLRSCYSDILIVLNFKTRAGFIVS